MEGCFYICYSWHDNYSVIFAMALQDQLELDFSGVQNSDQLYADAMNKTFRKWHQVQRSLHENDEARYISKRWKGLTLDEV